MKNLFPVLCFILAGLVYVGCSEDYMTQATGEQETALVDDSQGEGLIASKGKPPKDDPPGGGGGDGATFTVVLDIPGIGIGTSTLTPGSDDGKRKASVGEGNMTFTPAGGFGCAAIDDVVGGPSGLFSLNLVQGKRHPGDFFSYASVDFYLITGTDGIIYSIDFVDPPGDFLLDEWIPVGIGTLPATAPSEASGTGFVLEGRKSGCNLGGFTDVGWTLTVTPTPPSP